ncbi:MAG: tetratricopeptide repeat protein, partial [Chloroflexi bacterium]|nr:tetratricopeptide repeat protein [Chloroflexota bacterium]
MDYLAQSLLGPFQITLDGKQVNGFRAGKVRALFVYLSVESNKPHRREALMEMFWPDQNERRARQNLRQTLVRLRQSLTGKQSHCPFLHITHERVQFNRNSDYWMDVSSFESLAKEALSQPENFHTTEQDVKTLQQAANLYRGDFLSDFSLSACAAFENWTITQRERLRRMILEVLGRLAAYFESVRDYDSAQRYFERQLEIEPWLEDAHQALIRLLAWTGKRSQAMAQYEKCRKLIEEDLGLPLSAETYHVYQSLMVGSLLPPLPAHTVPIQPMRKRLPVAPASINMELIGRAQELNRVQEMLAMSDCRLLTIMGAGGIGKSTLAFEIASRVEADYEDGVGVVRLDDAVETAVSLSHHLISRLNLSQTTSIAAQLCDRNMLLVLDGFDHYLDDRDDLVSLLQQAAGLKIIVTSRTRLNLRGEWLLRLNGLPFPTECKAVDARQYGCVQLFMQTAVRVEPTVKFTDSNIEEIARICNLLKGHPLGIELAAGWVRMLSCGAIADQLAENRNLLTTSHRDMPSRHRSLQALHTSIWNTLTQTERHILTKLAVFRHSFDYETAQGMAEVSLPLLLNLWDRSLLQRKGENRYRLPPLFRRYAAQKLAEVPENKQAADVAFVQRFTQLLVANSLKLQGAAQADAIAAINLEFENITDMWQILVQSSPPKHLLQSSRSILHYCDMTGRYEAGERLFSQGTRRLSQDDTRQGFLFVARGWFLHQLNRRGEALQLIRVGFDLLQRDGVDADLSLAFGYLAAVLQAIGEYDEAKQVAKQGVAHCQALGDWYGAALSLNVLGKVECYLGNYAEAHHLCHQSLGLKRVVGDEWGV